MSVNVRGFGPSHPLWSKFAEHAIAQAKAPVQWFLSEATSRPVHDSQIRAIVYASSAEAAIRDVMRAVSAAGRSIDRYNEVAWTELEGTAYKL